MVNPRSFLSALLGSVLILLILGAPVWAAGTKPQTRLPPPSKLGVGWKVLEPAATDSFRSSSGIQCGRYPFTGQSISESLASPSLKDQLRLTFLEPDSLATYNRMTKYAK